MTKIALVAAAFVGSTAFAGSPGYDLKMELSINGKHISSPRVITKDGVVATITQKTNTEESFIEVIASEGEVQGNKGIMMKFVIGVIGKDGERIIVSQPQILARENVKAEIKEGQNGDKETLSLSVVAKRKVL